MKRLLIVLCSACLLLTGCQDPQEQDSAYGSEIERASVEEPSAADDASEEAPQGQPDGEPAPIRNQALEKVQGLETLPADCALGVKNYHSEMGWMEANAITHLERSAVEPGSYFLIVPQYAGSSVTVEPLFFEDGALVGGEAVYHIDACPDDYALIVNSTMPEASPDLRVTVTHGALSASYEFRYDGRGDTEYPVVQDGYYLVEAPTGPLTEYRTVQGQFGADIDYGHAGFGHMVAFTAMLPAHWEYVGTIDQEIVRYQTYTLSINIWGYMATETSQRTVTSFLNGGDVVEFQTKKGHTLYRMEEAGHVFYSFELEDGLCVMIEFYKQAGRFYLDVDDCNAVASQFRDSIAVDIQWDAYQP